MAALYIALGIVAVMVAVILYCKSKTTKEVIKPDSNGVAIINPTNKTEGKKEERISQKVNEL